MQQYQEIKAVYPDYILFYRIGDFYEMFFDDALTASRELELTLTGRDCGMEERAPMCGVPYHACEVYLKKLVEKDGAAAEEFVVIAQDYEKELNGEGRTLLARRHGITGKKWNTTWCTYADSLIDVYLNSEYLKDAKTIIWNGPVGVFEMDNFKEGTRDLAEKVAEATANGAFTIVGGGDTIAAAKAFNVADKVSYISTGGGAFLEFLEGKTLPAIAALQERTR